MLISRDSFSRTELHKERVYILSTETCRWCGSVKTTKTGRRYLFAYTTETDGGRKFPVRGAFCSISCMHSYYS